MSLQETKQSIRKLRFIGFPLTLVCTVLLIGSAAKSLREAKSSTSEMDKVFSKITIGEHGDGGWLGTLCDLAPLPTGASWASFQNIYFVSVLAGFAIGLVMLKYASNLAAEIKEAKKAVRSERLRDDIRR